MILFILVSLTITLAVPLAISSSITLLISFFKMETYFSWIIVHSDNFSNKLIHFERLYFLACPEDFSWLSNGLSWKIISVYFILHISRISDFGTLKYVLSNFSTFPSCNRIGSDTMYGVKNFMILWWSMLAPSLFEHLSTMVFSDLTTSMFSFRDYSLSGDRTLSKSKEFFLLLFYYFRLSAVVNSM